MGTLAELVATKKWPNAKLVEVAKKWEPMGFDVEALREVAKHV